MVTVWWSAANLIHYSFLNPSRTITFEKYALLVDAKYLLNELMKIHHTLYLLSTRYCLVNA